MWSPTVFYYSVFLWHWITACLTYNQLEDESENVTWFDLTATACCLHLLSCDHFSRLCRSKLKCPFWCNFLYVCEGWQNKNNVLSLHLCPLLPLWPRRWSWATARGRRLLPCGCSCLCPNLTSTASTKWTVTMATQWSTRSSSSPNASLDTTCWKWVTPATHLRSKLVLLSLSVEQG